MDLKDDNKNTVKTAGVADTLAERGRVVLVGMLPIYARPLTLLQVQEIGEIAQGMGEFDGGRNELLSQYAFKSSREAGLLIDAVVVALFRGRLNRLLLGWYVRKHLDSKALRACVALIADNFDYSFFFTSTIFLRGMKRREKEDDSRRGESWVES